MACSLLLSRGMKTQRRLLLAIFAALALCVARPALCTTTAVDLGTAAPPGTLGSYTMTPFGPDGRPHFNDEVDVPSPLGGVVGFSSPANHRAIGDGWATWSHGYTGDVYYTNGALSISLIMPANTGAFYLYAEPNPFGPFTMTVTDSTGATITTTVEGDSGANGFGFYTNMGSLVSISVSSTVDFAIGEFGIANTQGQGVPDGGSAVALLGIALTGIGGVRRLIRRRKA